MSSKAMILIDGENLLLRFEQMLKNARKPKSDLIYVPNQYVWSPSLTQVFAWDLIRTAYYTTVVGDDLLVKEVESGLSKIEFTYAPDTMLTTPNSKKFLVPRVFKKPSKQQKAAKVDINIAVDMLRYAHIGRVEHFFLITGDGDYVPLIQEVMRNAHRVIVGALSDGLSGDLPRVADRFVDLDPMYFE